MSKRKRALKILTEETSKRIPENVMTDTRKKLMISQIEKYSIDLDPFTDEEEKFREMIEEKIKGWEDKGSKNSNDLENELKTLFSPFSAKYKF